MKDNDKDVKKDQRECQNDYKDYKEDNLKENIFLTEEIEIEELAIDGICGVY